MAGSFDRHSYDKWQNREDRRRDRLDSGIKYEPLYTPRSSDEIKSALDEIVSRVSGSAEAFIVSERRKGKSVFNSAVFDDAGFSGFADHVDDTESVKAGLAQSALTFVQEIRGKNSEVQRRFEQSMKGRFQTGNFKINYEELFARYGKHLNATEKAKVIAKEKKILAAAESRYLEEVRRLELEELDTFIAREEMNYGEW